MKPLLAVFLPLLLAYATTIGWCMDRWNAPTQYFAHCWLVPLVAAVVVWTRRATWSQVPRQLDRRGWWLLAPALLLHLLGALLMIDSWSAASLVLAVPGAAWLALGRARLAGSWPVLWLVLFVVPMPIYVEGRAAFLLKEIAVQGGTWLANVAGAGIVRHGDRLQPQGVDGALWVADACSGLRSLLAMITVAYCLAFFLGARHWPRRLVLLALAPLLAIAANTLRIAVLCLLARWWGVPFAEGTGHTLANLAEWVALLAALLFVDGRFPRPVEAPSPVAPPPAVVAPAAGRSLVGPAVVLWLLAAPLLWLSVHRPGGVSAGRAEALAPTIAGYTMVPRSAEEEAQFQKQLPRWQELLGTGDFVWRRYRDAAGVGVNLVALFHDTNWKSVHPPRICIEGSNMDIEVDDLVPAAEGAAAVVSRIVAKSREDGWRYVTLSVFGTADWLSGDYWQFTMHHLPRAMVRANMSGFLVRVEAPIFPGEDAASAEARARRFLAALVPLAQEQLR